MVCYDYHFITFPFSRKIKNFGGQQVGPRGKASNFYHCEIWTNPGLRKLGHRLHLSIMFLDGPNLVSVRFCFLTIEHNTTTGTELLLKVLFKSC